MGAHDGTSNQYIGAPKPEKVKEKPKTEAPKGKSDDKTGA